MNLRHLDSKSNRLPDCPTPSYNYHFSYIFINVNCFLISFLVPLGHHLMRSLWHVCSTFAPLGFPGKPAWVHLSTVVCIFVLSGAMLMSFWYNLCACWKSFAHSVPHVFYISPLQLGSTDNPLGASGSVLGGRTRAPPNPPT